MFAVTGKNDPSTLPSIVHKKTTHEETEFEAEKKELSKECPPLFTYNMLLADGKLSFTLNEIITYALTGQTGEKACKIIHHWIKNASTRIFIDPTELGQTHLSARFILEWAANSLDAMRSEGSIGKFGLGFFSSLGYLLAPSDPLCKIEIETTYLDERKTRSYLLILEANDSNHLVATFYPTTRKSCGTRIRLIPKNDHAQFSDAQLSAMYHYLYDLEYFTEGALLVKKQGVKTWITQKQKECVVINLTKNLVEVNDRGCGIPLDIALTRLLVPSSSTKNNPHTVPINPSCFKPAQALKLNRSAKRIATKEPSHFIIAVGGVVVQELRLETQFEYGQGYRLRCLIHDRGYTERIYDELMNQPSSYTQDLALLLPKETRVNLGRNAIEFSYRRAEEVSFVEAIIENLIHEVISLAQEYGNDFQSSLRICYLYIALKEWDKHLPNAVKGQFCSFLKCKLESTLKEKRQNSTGKKVIAVPISHWDKLTYLLYIMAFDNEVLESDADLFSPIPVEEEMVNYNFQPLQELLMELYEKSFAHVKDEKLLNIKQRAQEGMMIRGFRVLFIENSYLDRLGAVSGAYDHLGLRDFLFVPLSLLKQIGDDESALKMATKIVAFYSKESRMLALDPSLTYSSNSRPSPPHSGSEIYTNSLPSYGRYDFINTIQKNEKWLPDLSDELCRDFWEDWGIWVTQTFANSAFLEDDLFSRFAIVSDFDRELKELKINKKFTVICSDVENLFQVAQTLARKNIILGMYEKFGTLMIYYKERWHVFLDYRDSIREVNSTIEQCLCPLSSAEAGRLFLTWLLGPALDTRSKGRQTQWIYWEEKPIWPLTKPDAESLTHLFLLLMDDPSPQNESDPQLKRNVPKRRPLIRCCDPLAHYNPENMRRMQQRLHAFAGFDTYFDQPKDSISLVEPILDLLCLEEGVYQARESSGQLKEKVSTLVSTLTAHYEDFFSIPHRKLQNPYGLSGDRYFNVQSKKEYSLKDIISLLLDLDQAESLACKVLDFYEAAVTELLSVKTRDRQILGYPYYSVVPRLTANINPLKALMRSQHTHAFFKVHKETLQHIVRLAQSFEELWVLSILIEELDGLTVYTMSQKASKRRLLHIGLSSFIHFYLRQESQADLSLFFIESMKSEGSRRWRSFHSFDKWYTKEKWYTIGSEYLKTFINQTEIIFEVESFPSRAYRVAFELADSFTCTQLLLAHINEDLVLEKALRSGDVKKAIAQIRSYPTKSSLQMYNECIEHASERDSVESTLLEAFQNSVDALISKHSLAKEQNSSPPIITFYIEKLKEENEESQLILRIKDNAGFRDLHTLLTALMIPNLSDKGNEGLFVGEMGNGFFQLLRSASYLTVSTTVLDSGRRYLVRFIPQRDPKSKEVVDLYVKCVELAQESPLQIGTEIAILFQKENNEKVSLDALCACEFIRTTIGQARVHLADGTPISLVLAKNQRESESLGNYPTSDRAISFNSSLAPVYRLQQSYLNGYALTGGIPFVPLARFLHEEGLLPAYLVETYFSKGVSLYIPIGSYTPVQSRQKITFEKQTRTMLVTSLIRYLFWSPLFENQDQLSHFFSHLNTTVGDFDQLKIPQQTITNETLIQNILEKPENNLGLFYLYFHSDPHYRSFAEWIDYGYQTLIPDFIQEAAKAEEQIQSLNKANLETLHPQIIKQLILNLHARLDVWKKKCEEELMQTLMHHKDYHLFVEFFQKMVVKWFQDKLVNYPTYAVSSIEKLKDQKLELCTASEIEKQQRGKLEIEAAFLPYGGAKACLKQLKQICEKILSFYCHQYFILLDEKEKSPPVLLVAEPHENYLAYYTLHRRMIAVNLSRVSLSSLLFLFAHLAEGRIPESKKDSPLLFVFAGKSGSLNHELEHARRGALNHADGIDAEGHTAHFEACAASWAQLARKRGAIHNLMAQIPSIIEQSDTTIEALRVFAHKLVPIEKSYPLEFAKIFKDL